MREKQDELRNEMTCDQGGVREKKDCRILGVWSSMGMGY